MAGSKYISVGDLKDGFNQVDSELDTMVVLNASGCYLPCGLTVGPTNGPEEFQESVFVVFERRLYKECLLFVDDLVIATGRPASLEVVSGGGEGGPPCVLAVPRSRVADPRAATSGAPSGAGGPACSGQGGFARPRCASEDTGLASGNSSGRGGDERPTL